MGRVVLVTGVSTGLGADFARQLSETKNIDRVIGVDVLPPRADLGAAQFVRADIRSPVIAKIITREKIDTVVHLSVLATPATAGGRTSMKELNVIGTMQLLAACQKSETVKHLIVKSSAAIYGSSSKDPAMFTEEMGNRRAQKSGFGKDISEVETYLRGFSRRRSDIVVTTLRPANLLGPGLDSPMAAYFKLPIIPTVFGYDARFQFFHYQDMLAALLHAVQKRLHGIYNLAGDGILMQSQAARRLGRPTVMLPVFALGPLGSMIRSARLADYSPEQMAFLTYGRGIDTAKMRSEFEFQPKYDTATTFGEFAAALAPGMLSADRLALAEAMLTGAIPRGGENERR